MSELITIEGKKFKEIKTADYNKYMREYGKSNYSKNRKHIRRMKNTRSLLTTHTVDNSIKDEFGEYLYDCKLLIDILQDFPSHLLQRVLDDLVNDGDNIFIKKETEI